MFLLPQSDSTRNRNRRWEVDVHFIISPPTKRVRYCDCVICPLRISIAHTVSEFDFSIRIRIAHALRIWISISDTDPDIDFHIQERRALALSTSLSLSLSLLSLKPYRRIEFRPPLTTLRQTGECGVNSASPVSVASYRSKIYFGNLPTFSAGEPMWLQDETEFDPF